MLEHALCPEVHGNPSKVVGAMVSTVRSRVTVYARGATLVDNCLGAHDVLLITLLCNVTVLQSNERPQRRQYTTASTAHNNQPNIELYIG